MWDILATEDVTGANSTALLRARYVPIAAHIRKVCTVSIIIRRRNTRYVDGGSAACRASKATCDERHDYETPSDGELHGLRGFLS